MIKGGAASSDKKRKALEKQKGLGAGVLSVSQCIRKRPNCVENAFHLGERENASLIRASQSFKNLYHSLREGKTLSQAVFSEESLPSSKVWG